MGTDFSRISYVRPAGGASDMVIVCGKVIGKEFWKLTKFSMKDCAVIDSVTLEHIPDGMVAVTHGGRSCVVLSYMYVLLLKHNY